MKTDLSYLKEMSGGNKELVLEMITIFREQVSEFSMEMDRHMANRDYDSLGKLAHKAKSSVSIMGLQDLAVDLKDLENFAREGKKTESYAGFIEKFKQVSAIALQELEVVSANIELYF
jgi:HPt (histidine-containing phosphotransfer) domain-containing protein